MSRFRLRQARPLDVAALWPLARRLNSYNLPADRRAVAQLVAISAASFRGAVPKSQARYLFVLEDLARRRLVGCSLIIAKHGTPGLPHLWMEVKTATRRGRRRRLLQLGMTTDGPTEVGGLILLPAYRGHPQRLGRQLSYVRFAYMAMHPDRFEPDVLVEYLPPLTSSGESPLWRVFGQRLTGMTYHQADRLSMTTKTFILRSFPRTPVDMASFPPAVRAHIGVVHPAAAGACALLRRIGFRYLRQVEPFDGGPYYGARRARITVVRRTRPGRLAVTSSTGSAWGFVCLEPSPAEFRAVVAPVRRRGPTLEVSKTTRQSLEADPGMRGYVAPF